MYTYGRYSVNYFTRNTDNLLVGWRFGAPALGFYKKAYDLFSLSASQLVASTSVVAVSALSRVTGDDAKYRRYLLGSIAVMAFLGMAISGNLTLIGTDLIRLLLGPGWGTAGKIFTYFAPGIGIMIVYGTHGWIHLSIGRADRWFRWGIVEWTVTIGLFIASLHWGPSGHRSGVVPLVLDSYCSSDVVCGQADRARHRFDSGRGVEIYGLSPWRLELQPNCFYRNGDFWRAQPG